MTTTFIQTLTIGVVGAALIAGCTSGESMSDRSDAGEDDPVVETRYGAVAIEAIDQVSGDTTTTEIDVQAQFLDARGVAIGPALDALEAWALPRGLDEGECRRVDGGIDSSNNLSSATLHLLDVGDIEVTSPGDDRLSLEARQLPDLLNSFHGVVYGSQWSGDDPSEPLDYRPGESYRVTAPGSAEAGGFDVTLEAPQPVILAAANGHPLYDRQEISVDPGQQGLELVWETDGDEDGEVIVELAMGTGPYDARLQCRSDDSGALTVPADGLRQLGSGGDRATLTLRRVHRRNHSVDGLDDVDFYFATSDDIDVYLR